MMLIVIGAVVLSVAGAAALQREQIGKDRSGLYSIGGYIAFIIAFALLEYGMITQYVGFFFGLWAAGMMAVVLLIGWLFYQERISTSKLISLGLIAVGLVGMALT